MAAKRSNLQSFLDSITPSVESYFLFKSPSNYGSSIWHRWGEENFVEYFTLYDLWESLYEWSVYGVGADIMLPNGQTVTQYFVPYLSAIQVYTNETFLATSRQPIYTIPAQLDKENCGACFLTYHSLSSSFQGDIHETLKVKPKVSDNTSKEVMMSHNKVKQNNKIMTISLPPFGLASLKANEALWNNPETGDNALAESLCSAAGSWLQQVQAHHHDYNFFISQRKN
ncbi:plant/protein (DUF789) [Rhynchospora pubera]|uniref:Plant/protein (DUF789) n=1 Tax=Rhynchospora pubera TaxID=906938 RepID=A0AAV8E4Y3_9POAL|nr:plant/protein (DUF789) [Rhynchospora pubera]KAJ4803413.1 plant/protein (DUF789) [Rhynchospora pubera]